MILIDSSGELDLKIEASMNKSISLGICVSNDKEYYALMALLTEKGFLWKDGTSPSYESWETSIAFRNVPLLIILKNYRITRSSYKVDIEWSEWGIDTLFHFSDFH